MVRAGLFERAGTGKFSLLRMLIVLAAVAALVRIVSLAISDQVAVGQPELALRLDGGNWKALMVRAEMALKDEKSEEAVLDARSALRADPLAAGAFRVLGIVEEKYGKDGVSDRTERLMRAAADVSRRDVIPQAWLLGRNLQSGDLAQAMSRLDLILRTQNSTISAKLVSLLLPLLSNDESDARPCEAAGTASALAIELSRPSVSGGARPARCVGAVLSPGQVIGPSRCGRAEAVSRSFDPHRPRRGSLCGLDAKLAPGTAEHAGVSL